MSGGRCPWLTALAGLVLALLPVKAAVERYEFERAAMGLPFRIVLYAPDAPRAERAAGAAFDRIAALNGILSDYDEASELSRLSSTSGSGRWVPLSSDLARVLRAAAVASRESDGAFDVTVGPLVQIWKRARRQRELPSESRLEQARAAVGWNHVELRRTGGVWEARLGLPGMRLDLGGIAKGYALDEAARTLRHLGVRRFLVAGGGDLVAGGAPPGTRGWRVQVGVFDDPRSPAPRHVRIRNEALATSGDTFQRVEVGGRRFSHIVDPRTGQAMTDHSLVTVIARSGMRADVLCTQLSVLGTSRGAVLARNAGAAFLWMRLPGDSLEEWRSANFDRWLDRPAAR
ncbi:MAG: FAD:protein FMN transferase [Verrucomicrobiae bacterium]|nr:FAD:protein FMN transferase [Verrucomicrobiae bacterium]